jgi:sugar phosphate permease
MVCCSFTTNAVYFGIGYEIDKFGFSVTDSMLIFGTVEIINYLSTMALMAYLPSIRVMLYSCAVIPTLICLSFFTDAVENSQLLQMGATAIVRFLITTYGSFYITYYISNLPKQVEGTAAGLIESLGSFGKVAAPYVVRIASDRGINSMGVFGFIYFVVGFLPLFFLPKTK